MPRLNEVSVEVNGQLITNWQQYRIGSDMLTPADAFDMMLSLGTPDSPSAERQRQQLRDLTAPGAEVKLYVDNSLQLIGVIDKQRVKSDLRGGFTIQITGRDRAAYLVDASMDLRVQVQRDVMTHRRVFVDNPNPTGIPSTILGFRERIETSVARTEEVTFLEMVRAAVEPWDMTVVAENATARGVLTGRNRISPRADLVIALEEVYGLEDGTYSRQRQALQGESVQLDGGTPSSRSRGRAANGLAPGDIERLKVDEAKPRPSETVWAFLDRHARRLGLMMWMSPRGELVVSSPDYGQEPLYRLVRRFRSRADDQNNVLDGERNRGTLNRYSEVQVYGRGGGRDVTRSRIQHVEEDPSILYYKPLVVHDPRCRTQEQAERRAKRELNQRKLDSDVLTYVVPGHGQSTDGRPGSYLWAVDTLATVRDEITGANDDYYLISRAFVRDFGGTRTELRLVPKGAMVI